MRRILPRVFQNLDTLCPQMVWQAVRCPCGDQAQIARSRGGIIAWLLPRNAQIDFLHPKAHRLSSIAKAVCAHLQNAGVKHHRGLYVADGQNNMVKVLEHQVRLFQSRGQFHNRSPRGHILLVPMWQRGCNDRSPRRPLPHAACLKSAAYWLRHAGF